MDFSNVLIGLWQIADLERNGKLLDKDLAANALMDYYRNGFKIFDMADHYGSAEEIAGHFKKKYDLKDVKFFTKWVPKPGKVTFQEIENAVFTASKKLQTEQIDLMQFHAWVYADPHWLDCLWGLEKLRQKGLIANIGLTNFDEAHLNIILKSGIQIFSNQVCFSLLDQRAASKLTKTCIENNVRILAFGTVAGGFFSEKWLNQPEPPLNENLTWSQMKYKRYIDVAGGWEWFQELLQTLKIIAEKHAVSIATIASAYIKSLPAVGGVIIGSRLTESRHIEENKKLQFLKLAEADILQIKTILKKATPITGDCGDEYRKPPFLTASGDLSHHFQQMPSPYPTVDDQFGKTRALSGTDWEDIAGFSRAVRKGNRIMISGTTATHNNLPIGGTSPEAQTHFIIDKIEGAIMSLGGKLEDIVRTRIYLRDLNIWESVARVHGQRLGHIQPSNTMVQAGIIGDAYLVEIEAEAILH